MGDGKHCPECGEDIGVWPIFSAGLPNRIWCPHCKTRLRYCKTFWLTLGMFALALVILFESWYATGVMVQGEPLEIQVLIWFLLYFAFWAVIELQLVWFLRNYFELEVVEPKSR